MYAILRVRGKIGINKNIKKTLELLRLTRANHCVLYNESEKLDGMLKKAKDYITWGKISEDMLEKLLKKRGFVYNKDNKLLSFLQVYDEKKAKEFSKDLIANKTTLDDLDIKPVFRLRPPKKGFENKGTKKTLIEGGALGNREEKINDLLKKMI